MLSRITGANSGIGNYLREGNKSGRFHSRDQMDSREVLHGDLELTESVIESIENKKQERYLHISLSFKESNLTQEKLEEITADYVEGLMSAYNSDEYNYYAEAHRPKLQNIYNPSTDTMDERLLHVHVVIPKKNLVSGGRLNPTGRHLSNIDYFDALQEKINHKHGLESPRENKRDILKGRTEAIARYSGEFYRNKSHAAQMKKKALDATKGADYQTFKDRLQDQGEIKIRNKGKANEYIAVKFDGEQRFTNLRESVFSKDFLDNKAKPADQKEIEKKLDYWKKIRSREIKYISDASKKVRQEYSSFENRADKIDYLDHRRDYFYQKNGYSQTQEETNNGISISEPSAGKSGNNKPQGTRRRTRGGARSHSLQELQKRTLVHQQRRTLLLLQGNADTHAYAKEGRADRDEGLRRPVHGGRRGIGTDGHIVSYMAQALDNARHSGNVPATAKELNSVDPRLVIDYCAKHYLIDTDTVSPSTSKSGAPRINAGSRNHTNTDYLTKEINLTWPEARDILESLYNNKNLDEKKDYIKTDEVKHKWRDFTENSQTRKGEGAKEIRRIKEQFAKERAAIMDEYQHDRKQIKAAGLSRQDRIYQTALSVRQKMVRLESLAEEQANTISAVRNSIKPFGESEVSTMRNLRAWEEKNAGKSRAKDLQDSDFESHDAAIRPATDFNSLDSVKRNMESAGHNAQAVAKKPSINDLGVKKTDKGADFMHNNQVVFRDHGDYITTSKETSQHMAELTLSYAVNRYGSQLEIKGSDDFKDKVVQAAYNKDFKVEFSDKGMNEKLKSMRELSNEADDRMDAIFKAQEAAYKAEAMPESFYGNDAAESTYYDAMTDEINNTPPYQKNKIQRGYDLRQNMLTDSARYRGSSLLPASMAIVRDEDASNVYETNLSAKILADKEELHFIDQQREAGNSVPENPNLRPNIERGEQLLNDFQAQRQASESPVRAALDSNESDLNARMENLSESLRLHHRDGETLSEDERQDAARAIEDAMNSRYGEIGGNDARSRHANKVNQNHQHRAMGAARALAHFDNGENPFSHGELKKVYDSEKRFTAFREAKETQASEQVDTTHLDKWDHAYRDEDGFTNAEYSAMSAGRELEDMPDQVANDPGLVSAYLHGAKEGRDDAQVAAGELRNEISDYNLSPSEEQEKQIDTLDRKVDRSNILIQGAEARLKEMNDNSDQHKQGRGGQNNRQQDQEFGMD